MQPLKVWNIWIQENWASLEFEYKSLKFPALSLLLPMMQPWGETPLLIYLLRAFFQIQFPN